MQYNCLILKNKTLYWLSQEEVDLLSDDVNTKRFITLARFKKTINVDSIDSFGIHPCFLKSEAPFLVDFRTANNIIYGRNDNVYYNFTGESWNKDFYENWERATSLSDLIEQTYDV